MTTTFGASAFPRLRAAIGRFAADREGNIAVIFAISAIPIISSVGAAIDYARANAARSSMQAALDSAALMLSKDLSSGTIDTSQIDTKASDYFNALYNNKDALNVSIEDLYATWRLDPANIKLDGSGQIVTDFMRVAGFPNMNFNSSSTTTWGNLDRALRHGRHRRDELQGRVVDRLDRLRRQQRLQRLHCQEFQRQMHELGLNA